MLRRFRTDKLLALFFVQWLLLIVLGCSHVPVAPYGDPERLWRHVQQAYDQPQSPYRAAGTIDIDAPSFRHSFDFSLRWENARRLRLDLTGPFGISLASAAVSDSQAWASIPLQGTYLSGTLTQVDSTASGLLNISLDRIVKALAGLPPREAGPYQQAIKGKDATEFFFQKGDTAKTFAADPKNGAVIRYTVALANKPWAELGYGDFRLSGAALRPYRITISSPAADVKLNLLFDDIKDVASFSDDVWRQALPEGTTPGKF